MRVFPDRKIRFGVGKMKKKWRPVLAGIMLIVAAAPYIFASVRWFVNPAYLPDPDTNGQLPVWPWVGLIILVPFWSPLLTGAVCGIFRRACGLAFMGAVSPLLLTIFMRPWGWEDVGMGYLLASSPVYIYTPLMSLQFVLMGGVAILLFFSRKDFSDREESSERLYAPPKNIRDMISE